MITLNDMLYYFHAELASEPTIPRAPTTFERPSGASMYANRILTPVIRDTLRHETVLANDGNRYPVLTVEPNAVTNLAEFSRKFENAWWTKSSGTIAQNVGVSPRGAKDMRMLVEGSGSGSFRCVRSGLTVADNARVTVSFTVARAPVGSARNAMLLFVTKSGATKRQTFNLETGALADALALGSDDRAWIQPLGGGLYRISLTVDIGSGGSTVLAGVYAQSGTGVGTTYTGDGVSGILIDDAVIYTGTPAYPPHPIDTDGSTVLREADDCTMSGLPRVVAHAGYFSFVSMAEANGAVGSARVLNVGGDGVANTVRFTLPAAAFDRAMARTYIDAASSSLSVSATLASWKPGDFIEGAYTVKSDGSGMIVLRNNGAGLVSNSTASTNAGPQGESYGGDGLLHPGGAAGKMPLGFTSYKQVKLAAVSSLSAAQLMDQLSDANLRVMPDGALWTKEVS